MLKTKERISFDENSKKHRELFLRFLRNKSWSSIEPLFEDSVYSIERKLISFYLNKEFKTNEHFENNMP